MDINRVTHNFKTHEKKIDKAFHHHGYLKKHCLKKDYFID